jgi:hypothetical protein
MDKIPRPSGIPFSRGNEPVPPFKGGVEVRDGGLFFIDYVNIPPQTDKICPVT